jgi:hypothetical protein
MGVPSPKKPWRAEAQRFAHAMGKRKRLGETTSRPFLACYDSGSGSGPHGTTPDWRGWYEGKAVEVLLPSWPPVVAMRCDAMIQSDKWAPWAKRRQRVLQKHAMYLLVYVAGFSLAGLPCVGRLSAVRLWEGLRG